ncbi:MAG: YegS/Rv2252/BmrU family lipid kinase [Alphaproteobacteria bacterium]|nr:YegS/Rv2252/BmrU family lipid kinase [Alphaproteobacteria bacterium]
MLIIFNPAAGRRGRAQARLRRVRRRLERLGCAVVVRSTSPAAGDAERLAREAEPSVDLIVAAGGDGTVNEVATGLHGSERPLAILPTGTTNVVAREIGMPRAAAAIAAVIAAGEPRAVWPGRLPGRLFLAMAGSGFDAQIVAAVDSRLKRRIGKLAFIWAILMRLARYRGCELTVSVDGVPHRAVSAIVAKSRYYAGNFVIAPEARLDAPVLHVVLFQHGRRLAALRYLLALPLGRLPRLHGVRVLPARSVLLAAAQPVLLHTDGEIAGYLPVPIEIAEQPLQLVWPTRRARSDAEL